MTTTLQDFIVPELFNPYVINRSMELSALYKSGIVTNNPEFDRLASEPAPIHNMPFFNDLTGEAEIIIEGNELKPDKITSNKDVSTTIRIAKAWASTDLSNQLADGDPAKAIATLVAGFLEKQRQKILLRILKGVFASTDMQDHVLDISAKSGKLANISASTFIDALQLLGDAQDQLTGVVMHSATKAYLKKQNLISTERDSTSVEFETYQGRRVVIDDGCPVENDVYTTYLFGQGAIALGNGSPDGLIQSEIDRKKLMGSGIDYLITRQAFIMHPRGIKWTNLHREHVETPTFAELENPENWQRVYEPKQIRMVAFKHKVG